MEIKMREVIERDKLYGYAVCKERMVELDIPRVGTFEKVSFEEFKKDMIEHLGAVVEGKDDIIQHMYDTIKIPERNHPDSASYKFYTPFSFVPQTGNGIIIPTGIKCKIEPGWLLQIFPPNQRGFKYGIELYNTINVYDSTNDEKHIILKITTKTNENQEIINKNTVICQGVFLPYGLATND